MKETFTRAEVKELITRTIARLNESRSFDWEQIRSKHKALEKKHEKTNPRLARAHNMMARVSLSKDRDKYDSARQTLYGGGLDVNEDVKKRTPLQVLEAARNRLKQREKANLSYADDTSGTEKEPNTADPIPSSNQQG